MNATDDNAAAACMNAAWLMAALESSGVKDVVISPGSRNAPILYAVAAMENEGRIRAHPHFDERGAAFFALGIIRATGRPVALVTTSGSAPAHAYPAIVEAAHAKLPIVMVSADRPFEMRQVGASQTTRQVGMFANHIVDSLDIPASIGLSANSRTLNGPARAVVNRVRRLIARARGVFGAAGPVHVNIGFCDPLTPPAQFAVPALPPSPIEVRSCRAQRAWEEAVDTRLRTVIVAGADGGIDAQRAAVAAGVPLVAEPSSGVFGLPGFQPYQQAMLRRWGHEIEQAVVFGTPTLSRPVSQLLSREDVRVVVVGQVADYADVAGNAELVVGALTPARTPHLAEWLAQWEDRVAQLAQFYDAQELPDGIRVAQTVWNLHAESDDLLVLGASNAIRYVDLIGAMPTAMPRVYASRGQAGIDGTIAFSAGLARGSGKPVRALVGDLTFLHDANSLTLAHDSAVDIVVLDDGGGRIFQSLEHGEAASPATYERFFAVGQEVDYRALASAYGVEYVRVDPRGDHSALDVMPDRTRIVHVPCDHTSIRTKLAALFPDNIQ
ncbi:MAG: 2-succinyl-5-enolpyruvyl-6-hydroxy-3-cyclohexene-1-carboxylic-acid synthase [Actinomycetaceae bacterium]|nr:2-succinyl-5-enolpyruvyl-6-hydroxy-3-cyclohexene-1-carboxylic-acid synthase [Actinomycetaceae bacterium]